MRTLLLICLLALAPVVNGQTEDELKALALAQANNTCQATVNKDYKTVLDYTLPEVLDIMGGADAALGMISETMDQMNETGTSIVSSEATKLNGFGQEEGEYRCVVETKVIVKTPGQTINATNYLVGIYDEDLMRWHFIEAAQLKNPQMKEMVLPDFETALVIPENSREVIPD